MSTGGYVRGRVSWMRAGLQPPFMLDRGVHAEEGALLQGVIAAPRAYVGCGATVRDSVLLERAVVGAGAVIERCVVLQDAVVPPGARLSDRVGSRQAVGAAS